LEVWGQWVQEGQVYEKFALRYAGSPSLFAGRTFAPPGMKEVKLQILAADQAGNAGQQTLSFQIIP
jgi:hypothetical protein